METNEFYIKGVKLSIVKKSEFDMIGYKKPANFGDGSIGLFINQLVESGKMKQLAETLQFPQQIWVCLSDCQSCDLNCSGFQVCCRVCVEKTRDHDFSKFAAGELSVLHLPMSEWVLYETNDKQSTEYLHKVGVYELVKEVGYKWNENIRLHFDNEHECDNNGEWVFNKPYYFLLPVVTL